MGAVKSRRPVVSLMTGDGTEVALTILFMQGGDALLSLRVASRDREPATARLGFAKTRLLITGLKTALEDLDANVPEPAIDRERGRPA